MVRKKAELRMVIDSFKHFYMKTNKLERFFVKMSDKREEFIYGFIEKFKEQTCSPEIQIHALNKFVEYQFNHYIAVNAWSGAMTIRVEWIFGSTSLKRWSEVDKRKASYHVRQKFKMMVDLTVDVRPPKDIFNRLYIEINQVEENDKLRFLNTDLGIESCILTTTLYNHKSSHCLNCAFAKHCKDILKEMYPRIYELRKYNG